VKGHPRHHERRRRVAAEEPVPLDEDDVGAGVGSRQRSTDAGRPASDDEDVGLTALC
jgi:hypothetical protein